MAETENALGPTLEALDRMRRAYQRGTGCHLTREMIANMNLSVFGEMWNEDESCLGRRKRLPSFAVVKEG